MRIIAVLTILGLLPLTISQAPASGQFPDGTDDAVILTPDEALEMMAEWYAAYFGVSIEDARRALILQEDVGELQATLLAHERDIFADLRIEHLSELHAVLSVVPGGEERVRSYFEDGPLRDVVQIEVVGLTQEQLWSDQLLAHEIAEQVGIEVSSDTGDQRVRLYTPDPDELFRRLRDAGLELPDTVDVIESPPFKDDANYLAGFAL